jgi:hypothetical protein
MANAEWPEKWAHRKCHGCGGPRWVIRYELVPDLDIADKYPETTVDFHPTCVGSWAMGHPGVAVQFKPGEIS